MATEGDEKKRWLPIAALFGVGVAALVLVFVLARPGAHRPDASGDAGFVWVYAQLPSGAVRLISGQRRSLPRPQDFAFVWTVRGTGPRILRIELEERESKQLWVVHEEKLIAPGEQEPLEFVLRLGDEAPDHFTLIVTLEAPHTSSVISKYPLQLGAPISP